MHRSATKRTLIPLAVCATLILTAEARGACDKVANAAGIRKAVNLHSLRHSFATHLYDRGVDIRTIQALLGHDKLETTARYARVATGLISAVESPLDRLSERKPKKRVKDTPPAK